MWADRHNRRSLAPRFRACGGASANSTLALELENFDCYGVLVDNTRELPDFLSRVRRCP